MREETKVILTKSAKKDLEFLPDYLRKKFREWVLSVEFLGIRETRLIKGFHDEPLKGKRERQRSVRLNKAYRIIYVEIPSEEIVIINVIEVHKHDY